MNRVSAIALFLFSSLVQATGLPPSATPPGILCEWVLAGPEVYLRGVRPGMFRPPLGSFDHIELFIAYRQLGSLLAAYSEDLDEDDPESNPDFSQSPHLDPARFGLEAALDRARAKTPPVDDNVSHKSPYADANVTDLIDADKNLGALVAYFLPPQYRLGKLIHSGAEWATYEIFLDQTPGLFALKVYRDPETIDPKDLRDPALHNGITLPVWSWIEFPGQTVGIITENDIDWMSFTAQEIQELSASELSSIMEEYEPEEIAPVTKFLSNVQRLKRLTEGYGRGNFSVSISPDGRIYLDGYFPNEREPATPSKALDRLDRIARQGWPR